MIKQSKIEIINQSINESIKLSNRNNQSIKQQIDQAILNRNNQSIKLQIDQAILNRNNQSIKLQIHQAILNRNNQSIKLQIDQAILIALCFSRDIKPTTMKNTLSVFTYFQTSVNNFVAIVELLRTCF